MALNGTMVKIDTVTVGSGGAASIEFTNIPQTYTDLQVVVSPRSSASAITSNLFAQFNGSSTGHTDRYVGGAGSGSPFSGVVLSNNNRLFCGDTNANTSTASTFGSTSIYIPNYTSSSNKSISVDTVSENNAVTAYAELVAGLFVGSAITSIKLTVGDGTPTFLQHSTATLYGISRTTAQIKATGGMVYDDADYVYHLFASSGTFTPTSNLTCDVLVVAGGGGGASAAGGGGGAGGLAIQSGRSVTSQNYTVTIGAGGAGGAADGQNGSPGANSVFDTITTLGGAGGHHGGNGLSGGSGGGAGYGTGSTGGAATQGNSGGATGYGFAGGGNSRSGSGSPYPSGGGGGAGGVGGTAIETAGGVGGIGRTDSLINSMGLATGTGQLSSGNYYYAGGGGGSRDTTTAAGGLGGGGRGGTVISGGLSVAPLPGTAFTGGGGGGGIATGVYNTGGNAGVAGGSGVVIVRYAK
jgi:hypothetical protein